jgi:hypothetical protein
MGILNEFGYLKDSEADKIVSLEDIFKSAFGSDINLDLTSPQGQLIRFFARIFEEVDNTGLQIFQNLDYNNASGLMLSLIAISKGQPRRDGTKAVIEADFKSTATGYTITAGSIFALLDNTNIQFVILEDTPITTINQTIELVAVDKQTTNAIITDKLTALTNYPLLIDIEITDIEDGTNIESDVELKNRLNSSDTETGMNDAKAISTRLALVEGVSRKRVFNNDSDIVQNGVPAYTIMAQVVGGDDTEIAQVILDNIASGTPTFGGVDIDLLDNDGYLKTIKFNRPTAIDIEVRITLEKRNNQLIDSSLFNEFKNNTQNYINSILIGDNVSYTAIFGFWASGNYNINKLELSLDAGANWLEEDLVIDFTEYARMLTTDDIEIIII